jgi:hypothetical protein
MRPLGIPEQQIPVVDPPERDEVALMHPPEQGECTAFDLAKPLKQRFQRRTHHKQAPATQKPGARPGTACASPNA